jgi:hypothetical protein
MVSYPIICVCNHSLITVHQEITRDVNHHCGRYSFCILNDLKSDVNISCWDNCKFYSITNKVYVICYNCQKTMTISLPRGKVWLTPGDSGLRPSFSSNMGIKSGGVSIKNIKFKYDGTYVYTETLDGIQ